MPQFGFDVEIWRKRNVAHQKKKPFLFWIHHFNPQCSALAAHYSQLNKELQLHGSATRGPDTGFQKDVLEPRFHLALASNFINGWTKV